MKTDGRRLAVLGAIWIVVLAGVSMLPFLFTPIPPLIDVPGHIGAFAVQVAPHDPMLSKYFGFHWALTLNMFSDLVVQVAHPLVGVMSTVWFLCAITPALTVIGILYIARTMNPRGAYAVSWALLFVFNLPFFWGFLNYAITAAFALIALAGWVALADRPDWRSGVFLVAVPVLLIGHGVAGVVAVGMIVGYELWARTLYLPSRWTDQTLGELKILWAPLLAFVVTIVVWKAFGAAGGGRTAWMLDRKREAVEQMLRDQNYALDVGSEIACGVVFALGMIFGARLRGGNAGPVVALTAIFLLTPSLLSGSDRLDTRLAPMIPMVAFALQDWSQVKPALRRTILILGFVLLGARFAVTTNSFIGYAASYRTELSALDHVRPGSRVLNLSALDCAPSAWRAPRLEHLANLATPLRHAWVNAHWSIDGLQMLQIKYQPSPYYSRDPSHLIWPAYCIDQHQLFFDRERHALVESMPYLPLDDVDYLWLVGERLPPNYHNPRLRRIWAAGSSELYAVVPDPTAASATTAAPAGGAPPAVAAAP